MLWLLADGWGERLSSDDARGQPMSLAAILENICSIYIIIIIKVCFIVNTPPISSGIRGYTPEY
jgi:hypothetical protein